MKLSPKIIVIDGNNVQKKQYARKYKHICKICREEFINGGAKGDICNKHKFYWICDECGEKFEIKTNIFSDTNIRFCSYKCSNSYYRKIYSKEGFCTKCKKFCKAGERSLLNGYCKECFNESSQKGYNKRIEIYKLAGECTHCGSECGENERNAVGLCKKCANKVIKNIIENYKLPGNCTKCGNFCEENERNVTGLCKICSHESDLIFCKECKMKTPHYYNSNSELVCKVCSGELIWCDHCNKWETKERNSILNHWIHYKSKTKKWIKEHPEEVEFLENNILGLDVL